MSLLKASPKRRKTANRIVVRLATSFWASKRGVHTRRDIITLRSLCVGHDAFSEDAASTDVREVVEGIVNLDSSPDGVYELIMVDVQTDWETGYTECWNWRLVPFERKQL